MTNIISNMRWVADENGGQHLEMFQESLEAEYIGFGSHSAARIVLYPSGGRWVRVGLQEVGEMPAPTPRDDGSVYYDFDSHSEYYGNRPSRRSHGSTLRSGITVTESTDRPREVPYDETVLQSASDMYTNTGRAPVPVESVEMVSPDWDSISRRHFDNMVLMGAFGTQVIRTEDSTA